MTSKMQISKSVLPLADLVPVVLVALVLVLVILVSMVLVPSKGSTLTIHWIKKLTNLELSLQKLNKSALSSKLEHSLSYSQKTMP